jgi:hypothetical protein
MFLVGTQVPTHRSTVGSKSSVAPTTSSFATGKIGSKAYPLATQSDEDAMLYYLAIMAILRDLLHTKIAQLLDMTLKMVAQKGSKQNKHVVCWAALTYPKHHVHSA